MSIPQSKHKNASALAVSSGQLQLRCNLSPSRKLYRLLPEIKIASGASRPLLEAMGAIGCRTTQRLPEVDERNRRGFLDFLTHRAKKSI